MQRPSRFHFFVPNFFPSTQNQVAIGNQYRLSPTIKSGFFMRRLFSWCKKNAWWSSKVEAMKICADEWTGSGIRVPHHLFSLTGFQPQQWIPVIEIRRYFFPTLWVILAIDSSISWCDLETPCFFGWQASQLLTLVIERFDFLQRSAFLQAPAHHGGNVAWPIKELYQAIDEDGCPMQAPLTCLVWARWMRTEENGLSSNNVPGFANRWGLFFVGKAQLCWGKWNGLMAWWREANKGQFSNRVAIFPLKAGLLLFTPPLCSLASFANFLQNLTEAFRPQCSVWLTGPCRILNGLCSKVFPFRDSKKRAYKMEGNSFPLFFVDPSTAPLFWISISVFFFFLKKMNKQHKNKNRLNKLILF